MLATLMLAAVLHPAQEARSVSVPAPKIVSRADWGAKPPVLEMRKHEIKLMTIHHTGVAQNFERSLEDKLKGLQAFSQREDKLASGKTKPVWGDIPYHYYISVDGRIGEGREWRYAGDTNTEYDPAGHMLVVVEGSFDTEKPTDAQIKSLKELVLWLCVKHNIPADKIHSHKDYAQTTCPGENLYSELGTLREIVRRGRID
jgi:hypothetical protein